MEPFLLALLLFLGYLAFVLLFEIILVRFQWNLIFNQTDRLLARMLLYVTDQERKIAKMVRDSYKRRFLIAYGPFIIFMPLLPIFMILDLFVGNLSSYIEILVNSPISIVTTLLVLALIQQLTRFQFLEVAQWKAILNDQGYNPDDYSFDLSIWDRFVQRHWYILARSYFKENYSNHLPVYNLKEPEKTGLYPNFSLLPNPVDNLYLKTQDQQFDIKYSNVNHKDPNHLIVTILITVIIFAISLIIIVMSFDMYLFLAFETLFSIFVLLFLMVISLLLYLDQFAIKSKSDAIQLLRNNSVTEITNPKTQLMELLDREFSYVNV